MTPFGWSPALHQELALSCVLKKACADHDDVVFVALGFGHYTYQRIGF